MLVQDCLACSCQILLSFPKTTPLVPVAFQKCLGMDFHHLPPQLSNNHWREPVDINPSPLALRWDDLRYRFHICSRVPLWDEAPSARYVSRLIQAPGCLPFPVPLSYCPLGASWDHLPNILLALESLPHGLLSKEFKPRWSVMTALLFWARIPPLSQVTQARSTRQLQPGAWTLNRETKGLKPRSTWFWAAWWPHCSCQHFTGSTCLGFREPLRDFQRITSS